MGSGRNAAKIDFTYRAVEHYDVKGCQSIEDFHDDMRKFFDVRRALIRFVRSGTFNERHILNVLICLRNCFGDFAITGLFETCRPDTVPHLKTLLIYAGYLSQEDMPDIDIVEDFSILLRGQ